MSHSRRSFIQRSAGCAGYLLAGLPLTADPRAFAAAAGDKVVAEETFARIEQISDGVWAIVSTPFYGDEFQRETVCNGGIIAGSNGVMVVEAFFENEGGAWAAAQARKLTGHEPTHVVVTHHHADHTRGLGGFLNSRSETAPELTTYSTAATRKRIEETPPMGENPPPTVLPDATIERETMKIDLGGKQVHLVPRLGHTASDVTVELQDPAVVWCGDMVWNGMFPNYVDSIPSHLTRHCEEILSRRGVTFIPGHGDVGDDAAMATYLTLVKDVQQAALAAHQKGTSPTQAAANYKVPDSLGEWFMFAPDLFERAFAAWEKELSE